VSSKAAATTAEATTEDSTGGKEGPKWRAAVDFKYIRDNAEAVQANADVRKAQVDVARVVALYDQWLEVKSSADDLRAARNASAAKMKGKLEQAQRDVRPPHGCLCRQAQTPMRGP
jgi:seryl-tRNA synthetase